MAEANLQPAVRKGKPIKMALPKPPADDDAHPGTSVDDVLRAMMAEEEDDGSGSEDALDSTTLVAGGDNQSEDVPHSLDGHVRDLGPDALTLIRATDDDAQDNFMRLANEIQRFPVFLSDEVRLAPLAWFSNVFLHPLSMTFKVGDWDGFAAIANVSTRWRAQVYLGAFTRRALGQTELWKNAARAGILAHDLLVLDAFIVEENRASQRLAERCGMVRRGTIREGVCYNGVPQDVFWYEIERESLGV